MNNSDFDAEEQDPQTPPRALQALHARLEREGATWRAQSQTRQGEIERALSARARHLEQDSGRARTPRNACSHLESGLERPPDPQGQPSQHTPPRRTVAWVGSIAALLIVALLAGLFLTRRGRNSPRAQPTVTSAPQRACASSEITASLPARSHLNDLAMTGPDSGWAVGSVSNAELGPTTTHALIMQVDQRHWRPNDFTVPNAALMSVAMDW